MATHSGLSIIVSPSANRPAIEKVFDLTYAQGYYSKFNFEEVEKAKHPQKVWGECINCIKFPSCDEIAMWVDLEKVFIKHDSEV